MLLGRVDFDVSVLKDGGTRALTQGGSTYIYEHTDLSGLRFASRHGDELLMWAIFERADDPAVSPQLSNIEEFPLERDTPELLEAFRVHRLRWRGQPRPAEPSSPLVDDQHHPAIVGEDGELVDLFISLLDRTSASGNEWWADYAWMAFRNFTFLPHREASRPEIIEGLREILQRVIAAGLDEAFLVRSLVADLDDVVAGREDTSTSDGKVDEMRVHLRRVVEDPAVREEWRRVLGRQNPATLEKTDEQLIQYAKDAYERFGTRYVSADDAALRWADGREWREVRQALLPEVIFEHWSRLSIQRAIDEEKSRA